MPAHTTRRHLALGLTLACGAAAGLTGCGSSGGSKSAGTTPSTSPEASTSSGASTAGSSGGQSQSSSSGSLGAGDVANVNGTPITLSTFNHWMTISATSNASAAKNTGPLIVPVNPPDFTSCIAEGRASSATLAKATTTKLRGACNGLFITYESTVLPYLIQAQWLDEYAAKLGVTPTSTQINSSLESEAQKEYPTAAKLQAFLASQGETVPDLQLRVRVNLEASALEKATHTSQTALTTAAAKLYESGTVCASDYHVNGVCR
jgi:hypothetical protein